MIERVKIVGKRHYPNKNKWKIGGAKSLILKFSIKIIYDLIFFIYFIILI